MEFELKFLTNDYKNSHLFKGEKYSFYDYSEDDIDRYHAKILIDDNEVGELSGYLIYNSNNFFHECDGESGNLYSIAEAVYDFKKGFV